jgi:hypothetical protein
MDLELITYVYKLTINYIINPYNKYIEINLVNLLHFHNPIVI